MTTTNEVNRVGRDAEGQDESRICAPAFWEPSLVSHLNSWFKGFGVFLGFVFLAWCTFLGLYHSVAWLVEVCR
jgi:hypothetical protein